MKLMAIQAGGGTVISATGTSASAAVTMGTNNALYIANTSATLYVAIEIGSSAPTAVITTDCIIPPMGQILIGAAGGITHVAAIASGAGPTIVGITPCTVLDS